MLKKLGILGLSAFLLVSMAGCGMVKYDPTTGGNGEIDLGDDEQAGETLNPEQDMTGTLKIGIPNVVSHTNAINAFIDSFKVKYPNIEVTVEKFDMNNYKTRISQTASAATALDDPSRMFDVFWLAQDYVNEWYDLGLLANLEPFFEKDDTISKDDLADQIISCSSVDGKMYMMPRDYNQVVMYYNRDMFDAADVNYPTSAMSAEAFQKMLVQLRDGLLETDEVNDYGVPYADGVANIIDCNIKWDSLAWPLLKSFGGQVVDETGEVVFNSDENLKALQYWTSLTNDSKGGTRLAIKIEQGGSNPGNQFRMQQAAIYFQSRAVISDIVQDVTLAGQQYHGIKNLGVCALPNFGGTYTVGGGASGYAMYGKAAHVSEAWQFLKHVVSVEGQNAYSDTGDCVPVRKDLLQDKDAVWRHPKALADVLPKNFKHDAFVEHMDAYASTRDFYQYVPFKAQSMVLAKIEEAFNEASSAGSEQILRGVLWSKAENMKELIRQAKG